VDDLSALHTLVLNSLEEQVAVIDEAGTIVDVNAAWIQFGLENGFSKEASCIGRNYLGVLSAAPPDADNVVGEAEQGIAEVIRGDRESFYFEYPCHSPDEKRWFMMRVTALKNSARRHFVISHQNITSRKLAEERAERLAMYDPLTGLGNRRHFNQFLRREYQRGMRNRSAISLVLLDVDNFKKYNDDLGHPAGDRCLNLVGRVLREMSQRPSDLAARLGGDEFALILGDTDAAGAREVAEALRKAIADLDLIFDGARLLTVSVGVASTHPNEERHEELLLKEADRALYRAKSAGRNRVVQVQPVAGEPEELLGRATAIR
jgi:diguanylate cyclase (GGDEF)-like protein/PAS domain S-box-containing protein